MNYNEHNDFVIDLDSIWKWLDFSKKDKAKRSLENNFILNENYKIIEEKTISKNGKGGYNREIILLNIDTFKCFCMTASTEKAKQVRKYFIKLENIIHKLLEEDSEELKNQIQKYVYQIDKLKNDKNKLEKNNKLEKHNVLLKEYSTSNPIVYVIKF
jgi:anti-repressor protein